MDSEVMSDEHQVESSVKETVISGAPSQYVSDRNRDRPQTPILAPTSPPRERGEKKLLQTDTPTRKEPRSSSPRKISRGHC